MKRLMVTAALLCACSGGGDDGDSPTPGGGGLDTDYSANFVGSWLGDMSMTIGGQTSTVSSVLLPIARTGFNTLRLEEMCSDGSPATAVVTSATTFRMNAVTCPAIAANWCSAVTFKYTGGTGTVANAALTVDIPGSMSGCGQSVPFTIHYAGTVDATVSTALRTAAGDAAAVSFAAGAASLAR